MNKLFFASVAIVALANAAVAAEINVPVYEPRVAPAVAPPPVVLPVFNWTSCYLGGFAAGAWGGDIDATDPQAAGTFYNAPNATAANGGRFTYATENSFIFGGTAGCNWQPVGTPFVLGAEGEIGYMSLKATVIDPYSLGPVVTYNGDTLASTTVGDWYGLITARLGYNWDRLLFYIKGGIGFTEVSSSVADTCSTAPCGTGLLTASYSDTKAFWTVGGGVEWAFDWNWSVKAEYLYFALDENYQLCGSGGGTAAGTTFCSNHAIDGVHTAKIGVNYRFGGAPLVARY